MRIKIKQIRESTELEEAYLIREKVFCEEQNVPRNIEMDEFDQTAIHILAIINGIPVGTARWRFTKEGSKMERFAVLKEYRGRGVGRELVKYVLNELKGNVNIYLYAQESVVKFYEKFGFIVNGPRFYEAAIPHRKMVLQL